MGDAEDLEALFHSDYERLTRTAYFIVGDLDLAREIAQESFARLVLHWPRVRHYENVSSWLRLVAVRHALRTRDHRVRETSSAADDEGPMRAVPVEDVMDLQRAMRLLPRAQRATVVLHYLHDLPIAEVADVLGIKVGTVKAHLHQARQRLSSLLTEEAEDVAR